MNQFDTIQNNEELLLDCFEEHDKNKISEMLERIRIREKHEELAKRAFGHGNR